jgi:hypothetical protein
MGQGAQLLKQRIPALQILLLFGIDEGIEQALRQLLTHGGIVPIFAGQGAQLLKQRIPPLQILLFFGIDEGIGCWGSMERKTRLTRQWQNHAMKNQ